MKMLSYLLLAFFSFCGINLSAQSIGNSLKSSTDSSSIPVALRTIQQTAFGLGERLVFDVGFSFIKAGEAVMAIPSLDTVRGREAYKVIFTVNSTPTFSFFFKVADSYETILDTQGIFPWRFSQKIREGRYRREFEAEFDQIRNIARANKKEYPIPPYTHDVISAFYFARTVDYNGMKIGDKVHLENFYKDTTYPLAVKLLGYQQLEVPAGTFNCVIIEPLIMEGGLFKSEGRIVIWFTNDDRKIPIKVSTKVVIGTIDAELREYSGIRGLIRSKIK